MDVTKEVLAHLEKCYALAPLRYQGRDHFLVASELEERCLLFDLDGNLEDVVWEKPGGVMSMVQVPGTDGQFLATLQFYGFNHAETADISLLTPKGVGCWERRTLADLPFVHRIDVMERSGVRWLVACTLKSGHEYDNDWRFPGAIWVAELPEDLSGFDRNHPLALTPMWRGLQKNHGYYRRERDGVPFGLICAENGIFRMTPPKSRDGKWTMELLVDEPASDAVPVDLDGDGEDELGVIAPFHGEKIRVYKKVDGAFHCVYQCPEDLPFSHAIYGGPLCGGNALVVGYREGRRELVAFTWNAETASYQTERIDAGCGPANLLHYVKDGRDVLAVANREIDEIALYELRP